MLHLFSTEQCLFFKTDRVLQSLLIICISTALVVVAWAEPSPSPRPHHFAHSAANRSNRPRSQRLATANAVTFSKSNSLTALFTVISIFRFRCIATLMSAESKARFYDSNIRKHYRSVLVRPRQKETKHSNRQQQHFAKLFVTQWRRLTHLCQTWHMATHLLRNIGLMACAAKSREIFCAVSSAAGCKPAGQHRLQIYVPELWLRRKPRYVYSWLKRAGVSNSMK